MPAPISVIIPTLNAGDRLGPVLAALGAALTEGLITEVLFADGGSDDDTLLIAEEVGARVVPAPPGRGGQMAVAAREARGAWLLFLHGDSVLQDGWTRAVAGHLRDTERAGYFRLGFDDTSLAARWIAGWANLRARVFGLPYGDQGLLVSRRLYDSVGGFDEIPLMEDVAMARKLRGRLRMLPARVITSAERYRREGWWRRSFRNAGILLRYRLGVSPEKLAQRYQAPENCRR